MRKLEKAEIVQAIQEKVAKSQIGILTDFKGLKVEDMTRLRRQLQEADAELTVVKNTLLRRAGADDSPLAPLLSHATGPNALTLGYADPVTVTKVLIKFAQEKPQLVIKARGPGRPGLEPQGPGSAEQAPGPGSAAGPAAGSVAGRAHGSGHGFGRGDPQPAQRAGGIKG